MRTLCVVTVACSILTGWAAGASAAGRKPVKVAYREGTGVVQPGATDGFTLTCPRAEPNAIGGYFGTDSRASAAAVTLTESAPPGSKIGRKWVVGVKDLTDQPQSYFAGAVCASGGPYVAAFHNGAVDAGGTDGFNAKCPRAAPNAVAGIVYTTAKQDTGQLELATSVAGAHSWATELQNTSAQSQPFVSGAVCASTKVRVKYLESDASSVQPGAMDSAAGNCPRAAPHAAGGGFGIPASDPFGDVTVAGSFPTGKGRGWDVTVANQGTVPRGYFAGVVCLG